jgi:hypothetical protein
MGGGSSKLGGGGGEALRRSTSMRMTSGPNSKTKAGPSSLRRVKTNPISDHIDVALTNNFEHTNGFVDEGDILAPQLGSQLQNSMPSKFRKAWAPFFSALQDNASKEIMSTTASSICASLTNAINQEQQIKRGNFTNMLNAVTSSITAAVNAIKWGLDGPLIRALVAVEKEVEIDKTSMWTDMTMSDFGELLLKHLGPAANPETQKQSILTRSVLMRAIQSIYEAVSKIPSDKGIFQALPSNIFVSRGICKIMRAISPFLLEKSKSVHKILSEYKDVDNMLFGSNLAPLESHMAVLDHVGKSLFLNLYIGLRTPKDLVLARETVFEDLVKALKCDPSQPLEDFSVLTLRAYFKSKYGKKKIHDVKVEEGEGRGPRKEFYSLASRYLQSAWEHKHLLEGVISGNKGDFILKGVGTRFMDNVVAKTMRVSIGLGSDDKPTNEKVEVAEVLSDVELRLDSRLQSSHADEHAWAESKAEPLFVYSKAGEAYWYNTSLNKSKDNFDRFKVVGRMIAAAIADCCKLDIVFSRVIFEHLLQPNLKTYRPNLHDLARFDQNIAMHVASAYKVSQADLEEMIEDGDFVRVKTADEYVKASARQVMVDIVQWQAEAMHAGFHLGVDSTWWPRCSMTAGDLQSLVCGTPDTTSDFNFREVFRVVEDPELQQCDPLRNALWATIDKLDRFQKRKLLRFITGVDRLPSAGTEMIKIEMPFMAYSSDEHAKTLMMMPQAHTCDNILELPNYWLSLRAVRNGDASKDKTYSDEELLPELRDIILDKVRKAFNYADGFGLDTAFD